MIALTLDHQRLVSECADDLDAWHPAWRDIDWPATLAQRGYVLLTDNDGSWSLLEPIPADDRCYLGHIIIAPDRRGKAGIEIARAMLTWIDASLTPAVLIATPRDRRTRIFLSRIGFVHIPGLDVYARS